MASFTPEAHASTPPILPPKPSSQETSRIGTPASGPVPPPAPPSVEAGQYRGQVRSPGVGGAARTGPTPPLPPPATATARAAPMPDPGDQWLPHVLQDKSKQDLADILASPALLGALTNSPASIHPSLLTSHQELQSTLSENIDLATQLADLESRLAHQRSTTQAQLLSMHALERQWRQKQSDMDLALARFSPAALYQLLSQSVQEQALMCQAMEESFFDRDDVDGGAPTSEREAAEWIRKYREAKVQYYLRQERKERWDEGRVGGWR